MQIEKNFTKKVGRGGGFELQKTLPECALDFKAFIRSQLIERKILLLY